MPGDRAPPPAGGPERRTPPWTAAASSPYSRPPAAPAASGTGQGKRGLPFWTTVLSTVTLATVANPYAVPPLQPNVVGPGGTYWAPPPPPQQLSSDEPAVATKKKGGPSKRKERKYTIEQLRAALYATIGAAARGAPRRPAGATPLHALPPLVSFPRQGVAEPLRRQPGVGRVAAPSSKSPAAVWRLLSPHLSRVCARDLARVIARATSSRPVRVCVCSPLNESTMCDVARPPRGRTGRVAAAGLPGRPGSRAARAPATCARPLSLSLTLGGAVCVRAVSCVPHRVTPCTTVFLR